MASQLAHMIAWCHKMLKPVDSQLPEILAAHCRSEVITRDMCEMMKLDYLVGSRTLSELVTTLPSFSTMPNESKVPFEYHRTLIPPKPVVLGYITIHGHSYNGRPESPEAGCRPVSAFYDTMLSYGPAG